MQPRTADCGSISRPARQGPANPVFRAPVVPGAVLQILCWLIAARRLGSARLPLVAYASFLGTDGAACAFLRRWGTLAYFGGSPVAMLGFARATHRLHAAGRLELPRGARVAVGLLLAAVGLIAARWRRWGWAAEVHGSGADPHAPATGRE